MNEENFGLNKGKRIAGSFSRLIQQKNIPLSDWERLGFNKIEIDFKQLDSRIEESDVNCHAYAFDFWKSPKYFDVNKLIREKVLKDLKLGVFSADGMFIQLLKRLLQERGSPSIGDLVIYLKDNLVTHSGKVVEANNIVMVESKIGLNPVFRHEVIAVSEEYGSPEYYNPMRDNIANELYEVYWNIVCEYNTILSYDYFGRILREILREFSLKKVRGLNMSLNDLEKSNKDETEQIIEKKQSG